MRRTNVAGRREFPANFCVFPKTMACTKKRNNLLLYENMQSTTSLHAVLVADVVASRSYSYLRRPLNDKLRVASEAHRKEKLIRVPYAVTAGDEFQTVAYALLSIPRLVLDIRRRLYPLQLRIGIGIGTIANPIRPPVNRIGGQAFEFARLAINEIEEASKFPTLTRLHSTNTDFDEVANLIYGLHDTLLRQVTPKQWETIAAYSVKNRVDYTAKALSVDASTASRALKRAYFWQMQRTQAVLGKFIRQAFY